MLRQTYTTKYNQSVPKFENKIDYAHVFLDSAFQFC